MPNYNLRLFSIFLGDGVLEQELADERAHLLLCEQGRTHLLKSIGAHLQILRRYSLGVNIVSLRIVLLYIVLGLGEVVVQLADECVLLGAVSVILQLGSLTLAYLEVVFEIDESLLTATMHN